MQDGWWPSRGVGLVGERWVGVDIGEVPREKIGEVHVVSLLDGALFFSSWFRGKRRTEDPGFVCAVGR
jgi:hypothetical protein